MVVVVVVVFRWGPEVFFLLVQYMNVRDDDRRGWDECMVLRPGWLVGWLLLFRLL